MWDSNKNVTCDQHVKDSPGISLNFTNQFHLFSTFTQIHVIQFQTCCCATAQIYKLSEQ